MDLQGKTVLIPGASRPLGRAIAKRFAQNGATLFCPVFDWPDSIKEMEDDFSNAGYSFHVMQCDLQDKVQVMNLANFTQTVSPHLDFLINNIERGGMPIVHGSYDLTHNKDQWDLEINTTLKAKWLLFHYFSPFLSKNRGGAVVNISSVAALVGRSGPGANFFNDAYSAANRAIASFTETWAKEAAPDIRVNELMIGLIQHRHGENTRGWGALTAEEKDQVKENILLGRTGLPEEVADAVYFLAVQATYMTGSQLRLDGGFNQRPLPDMPPGIL